MTRISSRQTFFLKRIFPLLFAGIVLASAVVPFAIGGKVVMPALIMPLVMLPVLFIIMRKLVWDLMDEVYDGGDYLLVKYRGRQDRIALSNIMNVSATTMVNPPRVTLRLVKPCAFGNEIAFSPVKPLTLNAFARNAIAEDLIVRVDKARRGPR